MNVVTLHENYYAYFETYKNNEYIKLVGTVNKIIADNFSNNCKLTRIDFNAFEKNLMLLIKSTLIK